MQVYTVVAVDGDIGNNSAVLYSIQSQLPQEHFFIDSESQFELISPTQL